MRWILVWWIIHPGHSQALHMEHGFDSESACRRIESLLPANSRHHCSVE